MQDYTVLQAFRLLSNQLGRSVNTSTASVLLIGYNDSFSLLGNRIRYAIPFPIISCRLVAPNEPFLPGFVPQVTEKQAFNEPDDSKLLRYVNRTRDIYTSGKILNIGNGIVFFPYQALPSLLKLIPSSFEVSQAWERGERFFDNELQNTYSYLIGASRVVNTTQRRTIVGYRCQGFRGLSPTPQGTNCEMEITEVDEPISYIVSTGDDGFIAQEDQKIPLRDAAVRHPLERNYRAGENSSCNHFTEGNHPEAYLTLRELLTTPGSPFFVPR